MLDRQKVKYEALSYECDEFIDGIHCADITGAPYDQSFKTLVMEGKSGGYYVFVVPIEKKWTEKPQPRQWERRRYDPCKRYHQDHRLRSRRLQPHWNEEAVSYRF